MEKYSVIVIGAGASGLMAAGRAAEKGAKVLLLEKMKRPGRKLMITGKGRCNITNDLPVDEFITKVFPNGRFLRNVFSQYYNEQFLALMNKLGVKTVLERGGRYFPESQLANDVVEALQNWVRKLGVEIRNDYNVDSLWIEEGKLKGVQIQQKKIKAKYVIVATGGLSYPVTGSTGDGYKLAESVGHTIVSTRPALVPLETDSLLPSKLAKLALKNVNAIVWQNGKKLAEEFGEMGFAPSALTGPIIITLSRIVVDAINEGKEIEITIDLKPALDDKKLDNRFLRDLEANPKKKFKSIFSTWLPSQMVPVLLDYLGLDGDKECNQITAKERKEIRKAFKSLPFKITGYQSWDKAVITAGGVKTSEINPKTLESKKMPGLYFAGEVIDVDAVTGGFNLQIAWSTGWVAGNAVEVNKE
ncbi:MAG: aminoacetone oxidase family FAD-binding enzyme [Salinivirgaceae bacterium]|nr:MAG: aminoacetone oxidase family FAD-binding enzyme [Salinivirgaceae bacterium]